MALLFLEQPCPRTTHRSPELSLCPIPLRLELPAWPSAKIPRIQIPPRTCINTRLKCRSKLRREVSRRKVIRCGGRSCDRGSGHLEPSASGFRGSPRQHRSPPSLASESLGTRDASDFQLAAAAPALPGTRKPPHPDTCQSHFWYAQLCPGRGTFPEAASSQSEHP